MSMKDTDTPKLAEAWVRAKDAETKAQKVRREIEDHLIERLQLEDAGEGSQTLRFGDFKVVVNVRMNRKVDSDAIQQIAAENGLEQDLTQLFRWTPAVNIAAWRNASENVTSVFAEGITTKPGRPGFKIEKQEDGDE